ncbi:hypothetical protein DID77_04180 [Candidatus Marinamargulisbacteria bacterium SCGC AG-439-L15]|nr:hypothetical protein DID77_04180 [Candidatus Marinamargulisbacteria bacterium SCGC AG-439-L15]
MSPNIKGSRLFQLSTNRKLALGSWRSPRDPSIYTELEMDYAPIKEYLDKHQKKGGNKLKLYHVIAKIVGVCLHQYPELNCGLLRGGMYQRDLVRVFFPTFIRGARGVSLLGTSIDSPQDLSISEISQQDYLKQQCLKKSTDRPFNRVYYLLKYCPVWMMRFIVASFDFLFYGLNINASLFGLPRDRFGSVMISPVGTLGLENAMLALYPFSRCPLMISVGKPYQKIVLKGESVQSITVFKLGFTGDHRYFDGYEVARGLKLFKRLCAKPDRLG